MAMLKPKFALSATSEDVFQTGKFTVMTPCTEKISTEPPIELFIVAPEKKGTYPVLLFCHGFMLRNNWYTDLLKHIASHGYIVVAPEFYGISNCMEVQIAAKVTDWLSTGLPLVLHENVFHDIDNLVLCGHSRGGKTAFALALGKTCDYHPQRTPKFKALIGIDPVAGFSTLPGFPPTRFPPYILQYIPESFNMSIPVAVIGTGYGNQSNFLLPPPAPNGVNSVEFFNESKPPAYYFLAKDYGHCDMLDDTAAYWLSYICKSGQGSKDLMRKAVGGIVVAFMRCYLEGDKDALNGIVKDPSVAHINLDPVIVKE